MADWAEFSFKLSQLYPGVGDLHVNTSGNQDFPAFARPLKPLAVHRADAIATHPNIILMQTRVFAECRHGAYTPPGADK